MNKISVVLVGAGAMGGALLRRWLDADIIDRRASAVFEPAPAAAIGEAARKARLALNPPVAPASADALVLAVKPQAAGAALPRFAALAGEALTISIMAGVSLRTIEGLVRTPRLVRAMPNLPAQIGAGVSGLYAPAGVGAEDRAIAEALMTSVGETVWLRSEAEIDLVTAVSGSGPAYYFLLTEALAEAAVALGLDAAAAAKLARATAMGAGALIAADPRPAGELRRAVTSPGGTTEAALRVLDGDEQALRALMMAAVAAAAKRARELSA